MINWFELEPMKYWNMPNNLSKEARDMHVNRMIKSGEYLFSEKFDGNWSRVVITKDRCAIQTRGVSKVTGTYGEVQEKVFFWESILAAHFSGDTVFLGEIYLDGGIDKDVGSIIRSKTEKAKSIQDESYYQTIQQYVKFTKKDCRDITQNKFFNHKLSMRIFDVLVYEGENLMERPLIERIGYINKIVQCINSPLVQGITYHEMNENFFDDLQEIFSRGGEGVVCYRKESIYIPGKRGPHAWDTCKIKRELTTEVDCFIIGTEPATKAFTGEKLEECQYWYNYRTDEKLVGYYFTDYRLGSPIEPISRGFYYGWPGAIVCGVYDDSGKIVEICRCSGLTDTFKQELTDNYKAYHMMPIKLSGMMISETSNLSSLSIRHPRLVSLRDGDINVKDCTLSKLMQS